MRHLLLCTAALMPIMLAAAPLPEADAHFPEQDMAEVKLGQLLFYDPILSGNKPFPVPAAVTRISPHPTACLWGWGMGRRGWACSAGLIHRTHRNNASQN